MRDESESSDPLQRHRKSSAAVVEENNLQLLPCQMGADLGSWRCHELGFIWSVERGRVGEVGKHGGKSERSMAGQRCRGEGAAESMADLGLNKV
jgi:hypothetical protein